MIKETYGKKIGMTQVFDAEGNLCAVTLLEVEPAYVLEKIDYPQGPKLRVGYFKVEEKKICKVNKPLMGYFKKIGVEPYKLIREATPAEGVNLNLILSKASPESPVISPEEREGQKREQVAEDLTNQEQASKRDNKVDPRSIGLQLFKEGDIVDVRAKTKGRGFAGGMKRHGWHGQPASHGSTMHRRIGSVGASAFPSRIIKGLNMPGHMGNRFCTIKNLKVLKVDRDRNILFLKGGIPGPRGAVVRLRKVSSTELNR